MPIWAAAHSEGGAGGGPRHPGAPVPETIVVPRRDGVSRREVPLLRRRGDLVALGRELPREFAVELHREHLTQAVRVEIDEPFGSGYPPVTHVVNSHYVHTVEGTLPDGVPIALRSTTPPELFEHHTFGTNTVIVYTADATLHSGYATWDPAAVAAGAVTGEMIADSAVTLPPTAEQERRQAERQRVARERETERENAWRAAAERADALFRSLLSPDQQQQVDEFEEVTLTGSHGHRWRIDLHATDGNVYWIDERGEVLGRFCAGPVWDHAGATLPRRDVHTGQLLALLGDERAFLDVAYKYAGARPIYPDPVTR